MTHSLIHALRPIALAIGAFASFAASAQTAPVGPSHLGTIGGIGYTVSYGDTYSAPQTVVAPAGLYSFTDAFTFTVPNTTAFSAFSATFNLGNVLSISNFQAALFNGFGLASTFGGTGAGSHVGYAGTVGTPVSGLAWNSGNGSFITLTSNSLAAGNYTLAVRGHVNGSSGGAYSGVLNVAPVPEASVMALMLAGIGVIGFFGLRRRGNAA